MKQMEALREIQAADLLGFTEIEEFRRALRRGDVPPPIRFVGGKRGKPVWSRRILLEFIDGSAAKQDQVESEFEKRLETVPW